MQGISEATSYTSVGRGAKPAKRSGPRAAVRDFVTPLRFGRVTRASRGSSIYRGSYPTLPHFRFLKSLKLKTVLSLTPEPPSADLVDFASLFNITIVHIQVRR